MAGENSLNELRNSLTGYLNDYHNSQTDNYKKGDKTKLQNTKRYSDEYRSYRSDYLTKRKELLKFLLLLVYIAKHNINVALDISNAYVLIEVENFYHCKEEDYFRFFENANLLYQKNKQLMDGRFEYKI